MATGGTVGAGVEVWRLFVRGFLRFGVPVVCLAMFWMDLQGPRLVVRLSCGCCCGLRLCRRLRGLRRFYLCVRLCHELTMLDLIVASCVFSISFCCLSHATSPLSAASSCPSGFGVNPSAADADAAAAALATSPVGAAPSSAAAAAACAAAACAAASAAAVATSSSSGVGPSGADGSSSGRLTPAIITLCGGHSFPRRRSVWRAVRGVAARVRLDILFVVTADYERFSTLGRPLPHSAGAGNQQPRMACR